MVQMAVIAGMCWRTSQGDAEEGGQASGHAHECAVAQALASAAEYAPRQVAAGAAAQRQQRRLGAQAAAWPGNTARTL